MNYFIIHKDIAAAEIILDKDPGTIEKTEEVYHFNHMPVGTLRVCFKTHIYTKHLLEHGHRKILTIRSSDPELKMYDGRTKGYCRAMEEYHSEPIWIFH